MVPPSQPLSRSMCPNKSCSCLDCADMREAEDKIAFFYEQKMAALSRINARQDVLTNKLPLEVVCNIFEKYVKQEPSENSTSVVSTPAWNANPFQFDTFERGLPFLLGAVCRKWRNIAWSHPHLWNCLEIQLFSRGYEHGPDIVAGWLGRSGGLPLDIRVLETPTGLDMVDSDHIKRIFNVLKQFSSRWRKIELSVDRDAISPLNDLHDSYLKDEHPAQQPFSLQYLAMDARDWGVSELPLHWENLSRLHITAITPNSLRWILQNIAESGGPLAHLSVSGMLENTTNPKSMLVPSSRTAITCLPHLVSLCVDDGDDDDDDDDVEVLFVLFVDQIATPALQMLQTPVLGSPSAASLTALMSRSSCALRTLIITDMAFPGVECITSFLGMLATVTALQLPGEADISSLFLDLLSQRRFKSERQPLLPKLQRLFIDTDVFNHWQSLIGLCVDDPRTNFHPSVQTDAQIMIPKPVRELREISCCLFYGAGGRSEAIDRNSVAAMAYLWQQHGVAYRVQEPNTTHYRSFLEHSYRKSFTPKNRGMCDENIMAALKQLKAPPDSII